MVCTAVLLRHLWPLRSTGQYIALGLIAAAGAAWAGTLLTFSLAPRRSGAAGLPGRRCCA